MVDVAHHEMLGLTIAGYMSFRGNLTQFHVSHYQSD